MAPRRISYTHATPCHPVEFTSGEKIRTRNKERVRPYIGGAEIGNSPSLRHRRYAITFNEMSLEEASEWPDLLMIVESKVKPERLTKAADVAACPWWKYWRTRTQLYSAIENLDRVLVIPRVGNQCAFAFLPTGMIYSEALVVFSLDSYSAFAALQARPHEYWARYFGSSMKDDLRYTPSDCIDTFPFPEDWQKAPGLAVVGKEYYEFRAALMVRNDEGLTKTYNRFHDPEERDPDIMKLRELHTAMDRAVLNAYDWKDIPTDCEFVLDYEIDEEEWGRKKKPWRYRWPDEVRDEVLARLLDLNQKRAEEERLSGLAANPKASGRTTAQKLKRPKKGPPGTPDLF